MNTRLLLWAFAAFAIGTSAHAVDAMPTTGDCKHPCPMMAQDSKMDEMHKGMDMGGKHTAGQQYTAEGKVVAVKGSGITIAHGPLPALKWPAMSMEFALSSPAMANGVKAGDTVSIQFVERNGKYVVTHLARSNK